MSNERCGPCSVGNHADCVWVAGACPECGPTGCLSAPVGAWGPGPESFSEDDRDQTTREQAGYPELSEAQKLAIDMSVTGSAWFDADGKRVAPESALRRLLGKTRCGVEGKFLSPVIAAAAPGIGSAIHAAMEAERSEAIEQALKPGALPEPFGPLNLTEWTAAMLADWQDATITSEELLTLLDEMLDRTLHSDACHIDPDDTTCICVIGQLRSVLPPCTATQPPPSGQGDLWHCTRKAHPASPDRHVWSNR